MYRFVLAALCVVAVSARSVVPPKPRAKISIVAGVTDTFYDMTLDGTASKGEGLTYKWTMIRGDNIGKVLEGPMWKYATTKPGVYKWELQVCDVMDRCHSYRKRIVIEPDVILNQPPMIQASVEMTTTGTRHTMTIDASTSFDDQSIASFTWNLVTGYDNEMTRSGPVLDFVTYDADEYTWELTVCDNLGACAKELFSQTFYYVPPVYNDRLIVD